MQSQTIRLQSSAYPDKDSQYKGNNHVPVAALAVTMQLFDSSPHPHQRETCDEAQLRDSESMFIELTNDDIALLNELISGGVQQNYTASVGNWTELNEVSLISHDNQQLLEEHYLIE
jgi:hypothetical protein